MNSGPTLSIEVRFDLICPWCLIGKRHLDTALAMLRAQQTDVTVDIAWRSYPLMPGIPKEGVPFAAFYLQRLGSSEAVAMRQAQVREAARAAGVDIAFDRIEVFPNSLEAHRLVAQAQRQGGSARASAVMDALFECYFVQGRNIGDAAVLADVQAACGIHPGEAADTDAHEARGSHGVPYFRFNDTFVVEGAQRPTVLVEAMLRALSIRLAAAQRSPPNQSRLKSDQAQGC
jgi:predicted DsbA family dithiol-disulfide isomerase